MTAVINSEITPLNEDRGGAHIAPVDRARADLAARYDVLRDAGIDYELTREAWFTLSHMLLEDGARVLSSGCGDGALTFTMAALYPDVHFIGLDKDADLIAAASAEFTRPNLEFKIGDLSSGVFEDESLDAIINAKVLHAVYSGARYNRAAVIETLRTQFKMLKPRGVMFLQDYLHPPVERYVQIELPDADSASDAIEDLSHADLLEWYAAHARPLEDAACQGFFLEEMPARRVDTRLYRLPYKWAYEFIMRLRDREIWTQDLPTEYMVFTPFEFRQALQNLGARVQYSAPHWDEDYIRDNFTPNFRLYDEQGKPLHYPPTSFVALAVKLQERESLHIEERRPSATKPEDMTLRVSAMRNNATGELVDIVTPTDDLSEIIPYRIDDTTGRLKIYLNDGVARSITNAVTRNGQNIDGKRWSGHMIEAIGVAAATFNDLDGFNDDDTVQFAHDYLGLRPQHHAKIAAGPDYYPSPDYIDERICTYYLPVQKSAHHIAPKPPIDHTGKFHAKGQIREFDAQQIIDAITVGAIPNARLELQILSLFGHLNITPENWSAREFSLKQNKLTNDTKVFDLVKLLNKPVKQFQDVKGSAGDLRPIHSIFVEEGRAGDAAVGLSAQEVDFVVHNQKTVNTVVVLPIAKDMKNILHAGVQLKHLPIPQRHDGNSQTVSMPSFELPPHIQSMDETRAFIADQFGIAPDMVIKLGESYFSHIGLTPQRIHPYALISPPTKLDYATTHFIPFAQMRGLKKLLSQDVHFMTVLMRSYKMLGAQLQRDMKLQSKAILKDRFENKMPDWSLPMVYDHPKALTLAEAPPPTMTADKTAAKTADVTIKSPRPFHLKAAKTRLKPPPNAAPSNDLSTAFPRPAPRVDEKNTNDAPTPEKW